MCIYLGDLKGLNYIGSDHIIPAGLGGIRKLPMDYVSQEFNNKFSINEQTFLRSSILALPRQILGPGKRGSLSQSKATKSKVNVFRPLSDNRSFSLGYIQQGKPYEIPNIILNSETGVFTVGLPKSITDSELQNFRQFLCEFESLKTRIIKFPELGSNLFLIGIKSEIEENFDCFIACNDGETHPFNVKILSELSKSFETRYSFSGLPPYKIKTHQRAVINEAFYQCCAKIAFNCLAHLKGKEFVMHESFNPIRNYIVTGGDNNFVTIIPQGNKTMQEIFPQDSHQILITKAENFLIGEISFYNNIHINIKLTENLVEPFPLNGFVCDWKKKKEYSFYEYLKEFHMENFNSN
jgi:hypothetical protein